MTPNLAAAVLHRKAIYLSHTAAPNTLELDALQYAARRLPKLDRRCNRRSAVPAIPPVSVLESIEPPYHGESLFDWATRLHTIMDAHLSANDEPEELHRAQAAGKFADCLRLALSREK